MYTGLGRIRIGDPAMLERRRMIIGVGAAAIGCLLLPPSVPAAAEPLPKPHGGEIILTIAGAIANHNGDGGTFCDLGLLRTLPVEQFVTETPWTRGPHTFTGVPLGALMTWVGARGRTVTADALNDYAVSFPIDDAVRLGALLVYFFDGQPMFASDHGPLWIVYPFSDRWETQTETYYQRSVWNVYSLTVR